MFVDALIVSYKSIFIFIARYETIMEIMVFHFIMRRVFEFIAATENRWILYIYILIDMVLFHILCGVINNITNNDNNHSFISSMVISFVG